MAQRLPSNYGRDVNGGPSITVREIDVLAFIFWKRCAGFANSRAWGVFQGLLHYKSVTRLSRLSQTWVIYAHGVSELLKEKE